MMFTQQFTDWFNVRARKTITIGSTIKMVMPKYIVCVTSMPPIPPALKSPLNMRSTSPKRSIYYPHLPRGERVG